MGWDWPPNSPDLTPLDFTIWAFLKELVTKNVVPKNTRVLELPVRKVWDESMTADYLRSCCMDDVQHRVDKMLLAEGERFKES